MRNNLTLVFVKLVLLLLTISSCNGINNNIPKEFLNHSLISKRLYSKDSLDIVVNLKEEIKKHENFFSSKEYYDSTQLIIDSIIYSPNYKKLAIFVIIKNSTTRQLIPDQRSEFYYNGNCFLGVRESGSISVNSIGPSFSNSINKQELSRMMRKTYFTKYATIKGVNGGLKYKYNIGDIRFWISSIWNELEEEKLRRIKFEKEKREHPENVYDPRRQ